MCFPGSSAGKEFTWNAGDPGSISGLGISPREGIGYPLPLQYSWASVVVQMAKNPPEMLEAGVRSLGWEDPLEETMAIHSSILDLENPHRQRSLAGYNPRGCKESDMTEWLSTVQNIGIDADVDKDVAIQRFSNWPKPSLGLLNSLPN